MADPTLPGTTTGHQCTDLCTPNEHVEHRVMPAIHIGGSYAHQAVELRVEYAAAGIRLTTCAPLPQFFGRRLGQPMTWVVAGERSQPAEPRRGGHRPKLPS